MRIDEFLALLKGVNQSGDGWQALCPAHEDRRQSLHVSEGDDGRILVNCFAGCSVGQICEAVGIKVADLFPEKPADRFSGGKTEIIAKYDYHNADGELLFQVCRTADKRFFQRRPNGRGGWINGLKGVKPVLYRLPEVVAAVEAGGTVFIPEGEKDVNNLARLGLAATTSPMGAGKWRSSYNEALKGANVVVLPDADDPGRKHAEQVAQSLHGVAANVKLLELPNLPVKGDVTDWLNAGGSKAELLKLAAEAPAWEAGPEAEEPEAAEPRHFTDLGNAMRLVELHGANIRYSYEAKKWYCWNGKYWQEDRTGGVKRLAKKTVRQMYAEAANIQDDRDREAFIKHALKSENENRLKAMVSLAQSEPGIPILLKQFDVDPFLLNCQNGTINLRTGELQEHKRGDYLTKISPIEYNPKIRSKVWETFLDRVIPDPQVRTFVQRFAGYSITGSVQEEVFAFPFGPPATGKSTFLRAIGTTLGDYAATADFEAFLVNKNRGGPRNDIARLAGKRFVVSVEVEDGRRLAEGLVNQLTGGDVIAARFLYQESFEFVPQFKLWLAANNRPKITGTDNAIWRRILQIPFFEHIPENERDPELKNILCDTKGTGPAILAWLVEGCLMWQKEGLNPPEAVKQTTDEYKQEMDPIAEFLEDRCILASHTQVSNPQLWKAYKSWCEENGEKYPLGRKKFTQALYAKNLDQYHDGTNRIWTGIGLIYEFATG